MSRGQSGVELTGSQPGSARPTAVDAELNFTDLLGRHKNPAKRKDEEDNRGWKGKLKELLGHGLWLGVIAALVVGAVTGADLVLAGVAALFAVGYAAITVVAAPEDGLINRGIRACKKKLGIKEGLPPIPQVINSRYSAALLLNRGDDDLLRRPANKMITDLMPEGANADQLVKVINHLFTGTALDERLINSQSLERARETVKTVFENKMSVRTRGRDKSSEITDHAVIQFLFLSDMVNFLEQNPAELPRVNRAELVAKYEALRDQKFLPYCEKKFGLAGMETIRDNIASLMSPSLAAVARGEAGRGVGEMEEIKERAAATHAAGPATSVRGHAAAVTAAAPQVVGL